MVRIRFDCPVCSETVEVDIREPQIKYSLRNPVPVVVTHGDPEHAITLFIDKEFRVRAISGSNIVQRVEATEAARKPLVRRFVPMPKEESIDLSGLSSLQIKIIALADGKKSVEELAEVLEIAPMRVKIVCEQLVRLGKLRSVQVVLE